MTAAAKPAPVRKPKGSCPCAQCWGSADGSVGQANARLIAAAPDLLDALKRLTVEGDCHIGNCSLADHAVAEAAIAKATGRPS